MVKKIQSYIIIRLSLLILGKMWMIDATINLIATHFSIIVSVRWINICCSDGKHHYHKPRLMQQAIVILRRLKSGQLRN
jgi:hypothetical protein